jgi:hypothetical protein
LPGGKSYKPNFEVRIFDFLNRRAEIEAGVWCGRARVFGDFSVDQHGEREVTQAMLTHLRPADITNRASKQVISAIGGPRLRAVGSDVSRGGLR